MTAHCLAKRPGFQVFSHFPVHPMSDPFRQALCPSVDKSVRNQFESDPATAWAEWSDRLARRIASLGIADPQGRLRWALADSGACERIPAIPNRNATNFSRVAAERFREIREEARLAVSTEAGALTLIGLAWAAAANAPAIFGNADELLETLDVLLTVAEETPVGAEPLLNQLLAGELPWVLGCCFGELKRPRQAALNAKKTLTSALLDWHDGNGLLAAPMFPLARPLLACWTRCLDLGVRVEHLPWSNAAQKQYEWAVEQSLRFLRHDGTACFTIPYNNSFRCFRAGKRGAPADADAPLRTVRDEVDRYVDMMETAVGLDRDVQDTDIALLTLPGRHTVGGRSRRDVDPRVLPQETCFSDWSRIAMLRSGWEHDEASLAVMDGKHAQTTTGGASASVVPFGGWTDDSLLWELNARSRTLWSGPAFLAVRANGEPLTPAATGRWTVVCSEMETAYDYLELELPLTHHLRLQRSLLLLHDEELLLLADTLLPGDPCRERERSAPFEFEYELRFPLGGSVNAATDPEATELLLLGPPAAGGTKNVPLARVLPLALPEWKNSVTGASAVGASATSREISGTLEASENCLVHRLWTQGHGLFAPILFDFSTTRLNRPYTWRPLTVGENLEVVPRDRAAAFRIRLNKSQYVLYRSLTPIANRTVLGHNLVSELLFGRFTPEGTVEPILEVVENED